MSIVPPSGAEHQILFQLDPPRGTNKFQIIELNYHKDINNHKGGGQLTIPLEHDQYTKFKINKIFELTWTWTGDKPIKIMNGYIEHVARKGNQIEITFVDKGSLLEKKNYLKYKNMKRSAIISDIIRKAGLNPVLNWTGSAADDITSYTDDSSEKDKAPKKKKKKKEKKAAKITHTNIQRPQTNNHIDGKSYAEMLKEMIDTSNIDLALKVHLNNCYVTRISNPPLFLNDTKNILQNSASIDDPSSEMINKVTVYYKSPKGVRHVTLTNTNSVKQYGAKTATIDKFNLWKKSDAIAHANKILHQSSHEYGLQIEMSAIPHPLFNIIEWCKINITKYQINLTLLITRINFKLQAGKAPTMDICLNDYTKLNIKAETPIKKHNTQYDGSLGKLATSLGSPAAIRSWIDNNIKYQFYYNKKRGPNKVLKDKQGNCFDQTDLAVEMMKHIGYSAWRVCGIHCKRYSHCNGKVKIKGRTITFDTTCSSLNHL